MRITIFVLSVLMFVLVGCNQRTNHRTTELKQYEGKTVTEAYMLDHNTAIMRFNDGEMLEINTNGTDEPIQVNKEWN